MPVHERVRAQAAFFAVAAFTVLLPLVLVTLTATSVWTGWVNVMAMHAYLDQPGALPGVRWAVPVAVQAFIVIGEATMVLNSVLRRRWILGSGAAATVAGYSVEIGAHLYYGEALDAIIAMIVAAVACGGGWALVAALMDRGVDMANEEPTPRARNADEAEQAAVEYEDQPEPTSEDGAPEPRRAGRRTREQLLEEVRVLEPDRPTLSPNFVAARLGLSWVNARSLLAEVDRLSLDRRPGRPRRSSPAS
ncbi:hypothetical protein RM780_11760 [Streptomyces sp. DSM 44917]|uniref:DUF2637 domain-containing protein n=1 Tax=Streptomyces boetiae TaxID=3075541 RepID=A0ABU2L815_9ACTN|nr:hypothetical protein [Streptomyces sp. DSM 44917]MDT0307635.1 hypothetical protein [Streptomyces sp. DSM 44917]